MKPNVFRRARPRPCRAADSCTTSATLATPAPREGGFGYYYYYYYLLQQLPLPKITPEEKAVCTLLNHRMHSKVVA